MRTETRTVDRPFAFVVLACLLAVLPARAEEPNQPELLETNSRAPYVHRITLYAEDGSAINPKDPRPPPYSSRATCGKCHPYGAISHGWHFNAPDADSPAGRPGEPWFLVDEKTGTVQAISGRGWPGTLRPQDAKLTHWQMVKTFGRHMPGGGFGEPGQDVIAKSPERLRWGISGRREIDCMFCHATDQSHDPAEAARQIEAENFRWAPTAALGLAVVRGEARKAPDDWDPLAPPDPDRPEQAGPRLIYDRSRFDADDRVLFNITRRPSTDRCYFCHTVREVGPAAPDDLVGPRDVHIAAGLLCVDCHRNDISHAIVRGYEQEATERDDPSLAAFSCEGCHLGSEGSRDISVALGGRYSAPHPLHRGLPPVHLEKLTCTACHSGPWPGTRTRQVQTAMAHRLGLTSRDRPAELPPAIVEPVFVREEDGKIGAHRLAAVAGRDKPYTWALAHDVRPAAQALGVRGCTDCHAADAAFFFGQVVCPRGGGQEPATWEMASFQQYDSRLARAWALAFRGRTMFKWYGFTCAAVLCLVLLCAAIDTLAGSSPMPAAGVTRASRLELAVRGVGLVGVAINAATAFGSKWTSGDFGGWALMVHMTGAGLVILAATGTGLLWMRRHRGDGGVRSVAFWLLLACVLVLMSTMLVAMLPLVGQVGQERLVVWHGRAAASLLVLLLIYAVLAFAGRRSRGKMS